KTEHPSIVHIPPKEPHGIHIQQVLITTYINTNKQTQTTSDHHTETDTTQPSLASIDHDLIISIARISNNAVRQPIHIADGRVIAALAVLAHVHAAGIRATGNHGALEDHALLEHLPARAALVRERLFDDLVLAVRVRVQAELDGLRGGLGACGGEEAAEGEGFEEGGHFGWLRGWIYGISCQKGCIGRMELSAVEVLLIHGQLLQRCMVVDDRLLHDRFCPAMYAPLIL
ncbi:uncharacterized protein BO97DRAFT_87444, partial [Aspergillus homomorphus CBS 101889]